MGIAHDQDLIPEYECMEAAVFGHLSWPAFQNLGWRDKARVVAHYKVHQRIEAIMQNAAMPSNPHG